MGMKDPNGELDELVLFTHSLIIRSWSSDREHSTVFAVAPVEANVTEDDLRKLFKDVRSARVTLSLSGADSDVHTVWRIPRIQNEVVG